MKYSEFEREVGKLGCEVYDTSGDVVVKRNTYTILTVNKNREFEFDNEWNKWSGIGEIKSPLFDLAYQLAKTPLVEREEEKLYRVKFPSITRGGRKIYLSKEESCVDPISIDWSEEIYIHDRSGLYTFTEQEIKDIDERYFLFAEEVKK